MRVETSINLVDRLGHDGQVNGTAVDVVELTVGTGSTLTPCRARYETRDLDSLAPARCYSGPLKQARDPCHSRPVQPLPLCHQAINIYVQLQFDVQHILE